MQIVDWGHSMIEDVWPLGACKGSDYQVAGSCVVIAPRLALTAKHCIEELWRIYQEHDPLPWDPYNLLDRGTIRSLEQLGGKKADFQMVAFQVLEDGEASRLWIVSRLWLSHLTDIALLHLEPYSANGALEPAKRLQLSLTEPKTETEVSARGMASPSEFKIIWDGGIGGRWFYTHPVYSNGTCKKLTVAKPFPHFIFDAPVANAMSGGPVVSKDGLIAGLLYGKCITTLDGCDDAAIGTSLWPALNLFLEFREDRPVQFAHYLWEQGCLQDITPVQLRDAYRKTAELNKQHFERAGNHWSVAMDFLTLASMEIDLGNFSVASELLKDCSDYLLEDDTESGGKIKHYCVELQAAICVRKKAVSITYDNGEPYSHFYRKRPLEMPG